MTISVDASKTGLFDPSSVAITGGTIADLLGAKLRRLARQAEVVNAEAVPPWVIPAAWAPSTAYERGTVVSNGGNWYVCAVAGTSASSGGPTATSDGNSHTDGTAGWTFYGSPTLAADDPLAPTISTSTSTPSATYPNVYNPGTSPNFFRAYGGYGSALRSLFWSILTFDQASGSSTSRGARVGFMTDAAEFAFLVPSNSAGVRLLIEDPRWGMRYYSVSPFTFGGTDTWVTVKFSTLGGRRTRRIEVEGNKSVSYMGAVRVKSLDQVFAPPATDDVRAVFISDSIMAGSNYGPWLPGGSVPARVGRRLGWSDPWNFSTGGTGYIATNGGASYTYGQRIAEALTRNPDVWVFMGSTNDIGQSASDITAAALAAYRAIRAGGSTAPIVVFGVWPLNDAGVATVESAVQAAVTQFADPLGKTFFIPVYADPDLPWVTGSWNNAANTNSVNASMYIAGDNTHPADIGSAYLAERIARAIRATLLPALI